MKAPPSNSVILIDDDPDILFLLKEFIACNIPDTKVFEACDLQSGISIIESSSPLVAVVDLTIARNQGPQSGLNLIKQILKIDSTIRIIVLTGNSIGLYGVAALEAGACSFLEKPVDLRHFIALVKDCFNTAKLKREVINLRNNSSNNILRKLNSRSPLMEDVCRKLELAAVSKLPVLITGETGTGKGTVAKVIHDLSNNISGEFIRTQPNYSSTDHVISELFGHQKNAFTGAAAPRAGLMLSANSGTLFIDEINEYPLEVQTMLLGVLQDKRFRAIGSDKEIESDFRLVTAMNKNPLDEIACGRLREDLYFRISKIVVHLPALRDRMLDLEYLYSDILLELSLRNDSFKPEISPDAHKLLAAHGWPGNIRELETVIEQAYWKAKLKGSLSICAGDIEINRHGTVQEAQFTPAAPSAFNRQVLEFKKKLADDALSANQGNFLKAAAYLGIDRNTLKKIAGSRLLL